MAKEVRFRRGSTQEHRGFTGALAEVTVDTSTREIVVHDGETAGGHRQARKPFDTVSALLKSREGPRGAEETWAAGGFTYREARQGALDHDLQTAGGAKLYLAGDTADVTALGAPDVADPAGRGVYAPALVTSLAERRLRGVRLREILGVNYDPGQDAAGTINAFLPELAGAGIVITDPENLELLCTRPIRIVSGLRLALGPSTTFRRGFAADGDNNALFSRADWSVNTDDFELSGGVLTTVDRAQSGKLMSIYGNGWRIRATRFLEFYGGQALVHGGDNNLIEGATFRSDTQEPGTGSCRMVGGRGFRGIGLQAQGGDDLFQFVPITHRRNARFNLSISDSAYIGCHGQSAAARVLVALIAGPQDEHAMTATIRNVSFIGCSGTGGNRCLTIENTEGDGRVPRQIDNVLVEGCALDGSHQNGLTRQDVSITASFTDAIGDVALVNSQIRGTQRPYAITVASDGARVTLDNVSAEAETSALWIASAATVVLKGGRYGVADAGGGHKPGHVVELARDAGRARLHIEGFPVFEGVAQDRAAIRLSSQAAQATIGDIEAYSRTGATGTAGVSHARGTSVRLGETAGDLQHAEQGLGKVRR